LAGRAPAERAADGDARNAGSVPGPACGGMARAEPGLPGEQGGGGDGTCVVDYDPTRAMPDQGTDEERRVRRDLRYFTARLEAVRCEIRDVVGHLWVKARVPMRRIDGFASKLRKCRGRLKAWGARN
jgi:hypothetical protein